MEKASKGGSRADGIAIDSKQGMKVKTSYGLDRSSYNGGAKERGEKMGGGVDNLSHSLSGSSANQRNK